MDPVCLAASIITILGLTEKCLKLLTRYIGISRHSSEHLRLILTKLYAFNGSIVNLQTHLGVCEEDQARLNALEYLQKPLADCHNVLNLLEDRLTNSKFFGKYLTGPKFDAKLVKGLKALGTAKSLFMEALHADQPTLLSAIERYIRNVGTDIRYLTGSIDSNTQRIAELSDQGLRHQEEVRDIHSTLSGVVQRAEENITDLANAFVSDDSYRRQHEEDREIIDWVSNRSHESKQSEHLSRSCRGTGSWFIQHTTFNDWKAGPARTLWCPGMPGAGKTTLATILVDHLRRSFDKTETAVACFYCNYEEREKQSDIHIFWVILRQIMLAQSSISDEARYLYRSCKKDDRQLTLAEVKSLLLDSLDSSSVVAFKKIFVIIDALDEASATAWRTQSLVDELCSVESRIHLMITSRPTMLGLDHFKDPLEIEIRADILDVSAYASTRLHQEHWLANWIRGDEILKHELIEKVITSAQGMSVFPLLPVNHIALCLADLPVSKFSCILHIDTPHRILPWIKRLTAVLPYSRIIHNY